MIRPCKRPTILVVYKLKLAYRLGEDGNLCDERELCDGDPYNRPYYLLSLACCLPTAWPSQGLYDLACDYYFFFPLDTIYIDIYRYTKICKERK